MRIEKKQKASDADDLSEYSESVKKRIAKLTLNFRDEEEQRTKQLNLLNLLKNKTKN